MKWWLFLIVAAGCSTKANAIYCESTCGDPNTHCDTIKHECVAGAPDMGVGLDGSVDDLTGADLIGADLTVVDLTPPPMCTVSATCPDNLPVCDSTSMMCRACSGAGEDAICAQRSAATPHCKVAGTNAGVCVACNVNADCPMATPTCNPDGTCRTCAGDSDCDSQICIFGDGTCVPASDVYYVDSSNDPGQNTCADGTANGKDGSLTHPYCQITTALAAIGVVLRHYVRVAGSDNPYNEFEIANSTNGTLTFLGPGRNATKKATIQAAQDAIGIHIDPPSGTATVALVGLTVLGNNNANVLTCGDSVGTVDLTIVDSSFSTSNKTAVSLSNCNARIVESVMSNAAQFGLVINGTATYSVQNCAIVGNGTGVAFGTANGSFSFNTITNNKGTIGVTCNAPAVIADSIVFNNKVAGGAAGNTQFNGSSTCVLSNVVLGMADVFPGAGKILVDPVFVSASDPHLNVTTQLAQNQMCCIDKIIGTGPSPSPSPLPTVDFEGNPRPKGTFWDIGCDEAM
jgi:hypothetical protein